MSAQQVTMSDVTRILTAIRGGVFQAANELLPLVYEQWILGDNVRRKHALRHGGNQRRVELHHATLAIEPPSDWLHREIAGRGGHQTARPQQKSGFS